MDMHSIAQYGPVAIALGAFAEGETAVLLGGAGLALGLFDFWTVAGAAFAGSLAGDQFFFWLGRTRGSAYLARHPRFGDRVARISRLLLRHRAAFLGTYRFIYGMRGVIPFAFGVSDLNWRCFFLINLLTAGFWSVLFTVIGVHAGKFLTDPSVVARLPLLGAGAVLLLGLCLLLRRRLKHQS
ncbi:MAG: VTT domain-containing protein [Desulfomicrobium sp.]|nr:VTT domain-containing protein [Pseudomonadota bacterium]MBU4572523.1 VTT domain-containing protein [Pseudomonadota bacterium]MBV1712363.1 VTT domain-containing protein [Desulfomicrobium sp.]MBV1719622.1 VTT domain-containing protein [Desulfomicrobium sp.]